MEYIKVYLVDFPHSVDGFTTYYFDEDGMGYYTIFLNARMNNEKLIEAYDHEINHINNRDFEKMIPIQQLESYAHGLAV